MGIKVRKVIHAWGVEEINWEWKLRNILGLQKCSTACTGWQLHVCVYKMSLSCTSQIAHFTAYKLNCDKSNTIEEKGLGSEYFREQRLVHLTKTEITKDIGERGKFGVTFQRAHSPHNKKYRNYYLSYEQQVGFGVLGQKINK